MRGHRLILLVQTALLTLLLCSVRRIENESAQVAREIARRAVVSCLPGGSP